MTSQAVNKENEWIEYLDQGRETTRAIKPREHIDTQKALKAKYPYMPHPTHRAIRTLSDKQRRAVNYQKGES